MPAQFACHGLVGKFGWGKLKRLGNGHRGQVPTCPYRCPVVLAAANEQKQPGFIVRMNSRPPDMLAMNVGADSSAQTGAKTTPGVLLCE
ncbi:MAG: hypothetical protein R6U27_05760 [Desulfobacterales bacterium]